MELSPEQLAEILNAVHSVGYAVSIFGALQLLEVSAFVFWFVIFRE